MIFKFYIVAEPDKLALLYHPKISPNAGFPKGIATVVYCTFPSEKSELSWWRRDERRRQGERECKEKGKVEKKLVH